MEDQRDCRGFPQLSRGIGNRNRPGSAGRKLFETASKRSVPLQGVEKISGGDVPSHTIHYGYIYDGEMIDEVLVMAMRGSTDIYRCKDTIEIDCHGGVLAMKKYWRQVLKMVPQFAEPGEFTQAERFSMEGSICLKEAVMDVILSKMSTH